VVRLGYRRDDMGRKKTPHNLREEAEDFDKQVAERLSLNQVPDLRRLQFVEVLYNLLTQAKEAYKREGIYHVICSGIKLIYDFTYYMFFVRLRHLALFTFQGQTYSYFYSAYSATWKNERAVEIPIVLREIESCRGSTILEVGNVLSQYVHFRHDIVDKYEQSPGVINEDIVDFQSSNKYELIVSISTLEHVGQSEEPKQPEKILMALNNLVEHLLSPQGRMVVTLPYGYNPGVDKLLIENKLCFTKRFYLKRISRRNEWVEVGWDKVKGAKFNTPFQNANVIVIGIFDKPPEKHFAEREKV